MKIPRFEMLCFKMELFEQEIPCTVMNTMIKYPKYPEAKFENILTVLNALVRLI